MMKHKITALLWAALLAVLPGCSLAREENAYAASRDRMAGVFVTLEQEGGESWRDWYAAQDEQGRLYADVVEMGKHDHRVVFPLEGVVICSARFPLDNGEYYVGGGSDDTACSYLSVHTSDTGETIRVESILYVIARKESMVFDLNPIYQDSEGRVYAQNGPSMAATPDREGEICSMTKSDAVTTTVNGEAREDAFEAELAIHGVFPPVKDVFLQMDAGHQILERTEYPAGEAPEGLAIHPGCAYVIHESHRTDLEGGAVVRRALYEREEDRVMTLFDRGDGICGWKYVTLEWDQGTGEER